MKVTTSLEHSRGGIVIRTTVHETPTRPGSQILGYTQIAVPYAKEWQWDDIDRTTIGMVERLHGAE